MLTIRLFSWAFCDKNRYLCNKESLNFVRKVGRIGAGVSKKYFLNSQEEDSQIK